MNQLVGAWTLVSCTEVRANGEETFPLGRDPIGQLMYSADGHMSAQLARRQVGRFPSDDWRDASASETSRAFKEYFGYFGTYSVDGPSNTIVHHLVGAWFPNLYGIDQVRQFRLEGDTLHIEADTPWGHIVNIWTRTSAGVDER